MNRATLRQAAKESAFATAGLVAFALFLDCAIWLAEPIQRMAGTIGLMAELILLIFIVLLSGRLIYDRLSR